MLNKRAALTVLALSLMNVGRADTFDISFTAAVDLAGNVPWTHSLGLTGSFTTDGTCTICTINEGDGAVTAQNGFLTLFVPLSFGLGDYMPFAGEARMSGEALYNRSANLLDAEIENDGNELLTINQNGTYRADLGGSVEETGTYLFADPPNGTLRTAIPEPSSLVLLLAVGLLRFRASRSSETILSTVSARKRRSLRPPGR